MHENAMHGDVRPAVGSTERNTLRTPGLDQAHEALLRGELTAGMQSLFATLKQMRATLPDADWKRFCRNTCRSHPIHALIREDLATCRSFEKPRDYAGDAVLLDFFYEELDPARFGSSKLGLEIFRFLCEQQTVSSLRRRRDLLAQWIDVLAGQTPGARVLSVACGHLREAHLSQAVREGRLGEFLAFDQDTRSLEVVERELGGSGVKIVPGNVRALLKGEMTFSELDFVYAAGLYDYLPRRVAIQLTRVLFSMLRPNGHLLVANYADPLPDSDFKAYMEAFMDWWLIYREEADVAEWIRDIPAAQLGAHRIFRDETGNLLFLEAVRR